jgi:hypothetical protein
MEPATVNVAETPVKPGRKRLALIVGVIVAALAGVGAGVYLLWPSQVTVPDLRGSSFANAVTRLQSAHLLVGRETVKGDASRATMVVAQSPAPGTAVAAGSKIDLVLSESATVVVPALVGKSLNAVERALAGNNLQLGNLQWNPRSRARRNTVLQQFPAAGQSVPAGSTVSLTLSGVAERSTQVSAATQQMASGQNANIAGSWRDAGGSRVQILQSGSTLRYSARSGFGSCQGNGVMSGFNFQTSYSCVSVLGIRSNGRCAGIVGASGNIFRLQCADSAMGRTSDTFTR